MSHAWRPVFVVFGVILFILFFRLLFVPESFEAVDGDYKYQYHRVANEEEWKSFDVKHKGSEFCMECHTEIGKSVNASKHVNVQCENCHAMIDPSKKSHKLDLKEQSGYLLNIGTDKSRGLCLRCHAELSYRPNVTKMRDPKTHNPPVDCTCCHDVHKSGFKDDYMSCFEKVKN